MNQDGCTQSILLAIKPQFVALILKGQKRYEFRRVVPKHPVKRVFIYESAPTSRVIGYVDTLGILSKQPDRLYEQTADRAGLSRTQFEAYFNQVLLAHAFILKSPQTFIQPVRLEALSIKRAPESFLYLSKTQEAFLLNQQVNH